MIVVADTSPLNYLVLLEHAEVLAHLYGRVIVPAAVIIELEHPDAPAQVRQWAGSPPGWIDVRQIEQMDASLPTELGGEREAISLALEIGAHLLLIDERAGRKQAQARRLEVTGTMAVLLRAGILGMLDFRDALERIQRFGFRISPGLRSSMLDKYRQAGSENS